MLTTVIFGLKEKGIAIFGKTLFFLLLLEHLMALPIQDYSGRSSAGKIRAPGTSTQTRSSPNQNRTVVERTGLTPKLV
jgi:hypothetical protein